MQYLALCQTRKCLFEMKSIQRLTLVFFVAFCCSAIAQVNVPVDNYSVNAYGQVQLSIQGETGKYYILEAQHNPPFAWTSSMTLHRLGIRCVKPGRYRWRWNGRYHGIPEHADRGAIELCRID